MGFPASVPHTTIRCRVQRGFVHLTLQQLFVFLAQLDLLLHTNRYQCGFSTRDDILPSRPIVFLILKSTMNIKSPLPTYFYVPKRVITSTASELSGTGEPIPMFLPFSRGDNACPRDRDPPASVDGSVIKYDGRRDVARSAEESVEIPPIYLN